MHGMGKYNIPECKLELKRNKYHLKFHSENKSCGKAVAFYYFFLALNIFNFFFLLKHFALTELIEKEYKE